VPVEHEDMTAEEANEVKLANDVDQTEADRVARAWLNVAATEDGRTVLWDIMSFLGMMETPLVPGQSDMTFRNIGRGDAAREIYTKLGNYPAYLKAMHQENGL
jgi:hypothetical protein